jgi:hypothetical protein
MARAPLEQLADEIAELRQRFDQFRNLLDEAVRPRGPPDNIGPPLNSCVVNSMAPSEVGPHLREVALRCMRLARESADTRTAREFEDISIELAERAGSLEAAFTTDERD